MRRSRGYGWRLLTLHGAGRFLIVAVNERTKPSYRSLAPLIPDIYPRSIESSIPIVLELHACAQANQGRR